VHRKPEERHDETVARTTDVRFEVFTAVTMKNVVFWDIKTQQQKPEYNATMLKDTKKKTPWPLVRKRTISTERPPLVVEI
jgi:hypothetical protein